MANITIDDLPPVVLPLGNDIVFETIQDGISRKITLPQLVSLMGAIAGVTANDTNPDFLNSKLVAGTNLTLTVNNPGANETLTIDATSSGQVDSVVAGTNITVDATDPVNPIVSAASGGQVDSVVAGTNTSIDATDPVNPIVNVPTLGVESIVAGTNVTVDATDPVNPIVSASGGGGGGSDYDFFGVLTADEIASNTTTLIFPADLTYALAANASAVTYMIEGYLIFDSGLGGTDIDPGIRLKLEDTDLTITPPGTGNLVMASTNSGASFTEVDARSDFTVRRPINSPELQLPTSSSGGGATAQFLCYYERPAGSSAGDLRLGFAQNVARGFPEEVELIQGSYLKVKVIS